MKHINENFIQGEIAQETIQQGMESLFVKNELVKIFNQTSYNSGVCEHCANYNACNEDGDQESTKTDVKNCFTDQ